MNSADYSPGKMKRKRFTGPQDALIVYLISCISKHGLPVIHPESLAGQYSRTARLRKKVNSERLSIDIFSQRKLLQPCVLRLSLLQAPSCCGGDSGKSQACVADDAGRQPAGCAAAGVRGNHGFRSPVQDLPEFSQPNETDGDKTCNYEAAQRNAL
jgi:hypothetical protein